MIFQRFFDRNLAQASYLIGCSTTGQALVVDPNRNVDQYLQAAYAENLRLGHVTETHIHADFVSGARELSQRTGARLYLSGAGGPEWSYEYAEAHPATLLRDGSSLEVGSVQVTVWHMPGHTPEHLVFLVTDSETSNHPMGALTGDFLFVGDVGRPDLLERVAQVEGSMASAAQQLFHSIHRFAGQPDYLQIWPGHGAGSACGKSLSAVPQSTLGYEKRFNWAFQIQDEEAFVAAVLAGQPEPPPYFARMKRINRSGPPPLRAVRPDKFSEVTLKGALARGETVVDIRNTSEYLRAAIPGTINIPANRSFTTWAGSLLPCDRDLYFILDERGERVLDQLTLDLAGIGLERVAGYFTVDVIDRWRRIDGQLQRIPSLTLAEFTRIRGQNSNLVLDVRGEGEWNAGHVPGARHLPLLDLERQLHQLPRGRPVIVHCQTGSRAGIAASLLKARGFSEVHLFAGGFAEWRAAGNPVETSSSLRSE
jgi:hydroxyacylglutathione hydrolase